MDFGSEMLSVDHADISKRNIGNNHCISWAKRVFPCIRPLYNDPLSNATNDRVLWVKILRITTIK
jgi:hypothetical protein